MKMKLRTRLTASFAATALICVILIGVLSNLQLEKHFKDYVRQNQEKKNKEIVGLITSKLQREGAWDPQSVQDVGLYAMEQGLILEVRDQTDRLVWGAYAYNQGYCQEMIQTMTYRMKGGEGELIQETFPVVRSGVPMGTVYLSYYGPVYYDDLDLHFIQTLNHIFIGVGLFSLALALGLGFMLSQRISTPITRVIQTAQSIARGTPGVRVKTDSETAEIRQLTESINDLAQTLEQQEALRRRLTGDVAHELRTPLATLQSHMEAMIDGVWEPTSERLSGIHDEITRLTRLVSDLERLARYEGDGLVLDKTRFSLQEFAQQLLMSFEAALAQKGVTLRVDCGETLIWADRDKLSQVLVNLVANALRFTGQGGHITVSAAETPQGTALMVTDTGAGIAPEHLPHIFERFYRADVSRNRSTGGAGIGLTLVKAIAEAHGGTVTVSSVVGEGTGFALYFPKE